MKRPGREEVSVFPSKPGFRAWMEEHHGTVDALWVGFYRKGVDRVAVSYDDAVEVALAFGWIDGITYRIDDELRAMRFTPRRRGSNWSAVNVGRMRRIIEAGEAHPAGIAAYEARTAAGAGAYSYEQRPQSLPAEAEARIRATEAAWAFWEARAPSYRRAAAHWVLSAKREETRERRLATLIADCAAGRLIRPLAYGSRPESGG